MLALEVLRHYSSLPIPCHGLAKDNNDPYETGVLRALLIHARTHGNENLCLNCPAQERCATAGKMAAIMDAVRLGIINTRQGPLTAAGADCAAT